jgi:DNA invertase Pin-like site-specific DNA recombinase
MKSIKDSVAIYARVSTLDQKPENQIHVLREYVKRREFSVYKEYIDYASGASDTRPALNDLMVDARRGAFNIVIVWKLDRLGRSLQHLIQTIEEFNNTNVDLISTTQNLDTTTASGRLVFHIFGAIAEFERELIRERIYIGIARAKREGKHCGRPNGKKDKHPRRTSGYVQRWANESKKGSPIKNKVSRKEKTL